MKSSYLQQYLLFSSITLLLVYVTYRAYNLSLTYDECLSYEIVLDANHKLASTANNHLLNTFLMRICHNIWGNNEFVLRLPNVIAFFIYVFFSIKILLEHKTKVFLFIVGFSLLLLNPFLLDFFSLARGYGLSIALFIGGYYYITKAVELSSEEGKLGYDDTINQNILLSLLFASLSTFANLTMINFLITIIIVGGWKHLRYTSNRLALWKYCLVGIVLSIVLYINLNQLFFLKENNELYHGTGSLTQAFQSAIHYSLYLSYDHSYEVSTINFIMLGILFLWVIGLSILIITKEKFEGLLFTMLIFGSMLLGLVFEHLLFKAKYPSDRTTLVYLVTGVLLLYHTLIAINTYNIFARSFTKLSSILVTALCLYNFSVSANLHYCSIWQFDYPTKQVMRLIHQISSYDKGYYTISNTNFLTPGILYYKNYYNINMGYPTNDIPDNPNPTVFIYSWSNDTPKRNYTAIAHFETNKHTLFIHNDYLDRYTNHRKVYD
jgi:hypothetical protein